MEIEFEKLNGVFQYALHNRYSGFYRELYDRPGETVPSGIGGLSDWRALPFLRKEDLIATPLLERIFTDTRSVDSIRASSGTSGRNVLLTPRNRTMDYRDRGGVLRALPKGVMYFHSPQHDMEATFRNFFGGISILVGDITHPKLSVEMAVKAEVDAMMGFVFVLDIIIPYLKQYDYLEKIKYLELMGEKMTVQQLEHYQRLFPNAQMYIHYGASEQQGVVLAAAHNDDPDKRFVMSQWPEYYIELIDPVSEEILEGINQTGELVITTLWTAGNVFPLLRYRTGDLVTRVTPVDEGHTYGYVIQGRIDGERKKIAGGEISVEGLERALSSYGSALLDFEAHIAAEEDDGTFKPRLEIRVVAPNVVDTGELETFIGKNLMVSPTRVYDDNVKSGFYLPLVCRQVAALSSQSGKRKRLFTDS